MRDELKDSYGFIKLQDKILEIAVYIDKLCFANNIDYCLMGGSALGARRHKGFIPWDDDLDIFMTPDNYEKFRDVFRKTGDNKTFYLQEWGAVDGMITIAKLRMNGTTYIEKIIKDWDIHQGVFVDIFILHKCPKNIFSRIHQMLWAKYVIMKGLSIRGYNRRKNFLGLCLKILKIFPDKMFIRYGLKQVYKYRNKKTDLVCNFLGKAVYKNAIYESSFFIPTEYVAFEKTKLKVPTNLDKFLTIRFGDYMKIPSPERIKWEQHSYKWDVDKDFHDYLSNCTFNYSDETKLI